MTDFAKEARDLPDFAEETYAITAVFRGEHMDDAAMTVIDRRVTEALRRMYAAGMAKAAEIARAYDFNGDQIAEAILAASPPKES